MNPNPHALKAALLLLGETEDSIANEYLFKRQPLQPDHRRATAPQAGEPGHVPSFFPEWATEQHQQDLLALQQFAWERLFAEILKAQRLEQQRPELLRDADFLSPTARPSSTPLGSCPATHLLWPVAALSVPSRSPTSPGIGSELGPRRTRNDC